MKRKNFKWTRSPGGAMWMRLLPADEPERIPANRRQQLDGSEWWRASTLRSPTYEQVGRNAAREIERMPGGEHKTCSGTVFQGSHWRFAKLAHSVDKPTLSVADGKMELKMQVDSARTGRYRRNPRASSPWSPSADAAPAGAKATSLTVGRSAASGGAKEIGNAEFAAGPPA